MPQPKTRQLQLSVSAVLGLPEGPAISYRQSAMKYGIPKSTIQRLVNEVRGKFSGEQVATPEELRAEVGHIAIEHELPRKGPAMIFTVEEELFLEEIVLQAQCARMRGRRVKKEWRGAVVCQLVIKTLFMSR